MIKSKKILCIDLPKALNIALKEQLTLFKEIEIVTEEDSNADVVVIGREVDPSLFPGCPILDVSKKQVWRLGHILHQIAQMLAAPVLYIKEIMISSYIFKPQEKILYTRDQKEISLTDREVNILVYLSRFKGNPVSRDQLLKDIWDYKEGLDTHTLETHIYRLRQKIEVSAEDPKILCTMEGGYSLHLNE